jgi:predicted  nucleic acid-binding Zn-ribbon protein
MATTSIAQDAQCPSCGGAMHQRPEAEMTADHAWCGVWFDCDNPRCHGSILHTSDELQAQLDEQARKVEATKRTTSARAEVASLELALHQLRGTGGRQRERIEVWLQGARVALAIAEREVQ